MLYGRLEHNEQEHILKPLRLAACQTTTPNPPAQICNTTTHGCFQSETKKAKKEHNQRLKQENKTETKTYINHPKTKLEKNN